MKTIKIKLLTETAKIPQKMSRLAAGYDLFSDTNKTLLPGTFTFIPLGFCMEMDFDFEAQIRPRSGLAGKYGITVLNSPGTIDADYRGEIKVILINHSSNSFRITKGMRIAQMLFSKVEQTELKEVKKDLKETERKTKGFGSTGL